jgi:pimeloyl-ACP methyl ester carboxylesterase
MGLNRRPAIMLAAVLVGASIIAGCSPAATAPAPPDITAAPTQVAHTALGTVGYRQVGHGPTLLMITGFSGSMDDWAPYFVDALAEHFRVIVFDNAGIGKTAALAAPLSVPEMAAQTSALISTLRLGRCDVLGWSMGGLIAQSLAVTHPGQVRRLVLAATQAGTGKAAPVPAAAQAALDSGGGGAALRLLFPADQVAATERYITGILAYPGRYAASAAVRAAQQAAIDQWFAGNDVSGRDPGEIRAPTLVADGTEDALSPAANDRMLARLIHGARLVLYPGAGHGFLFQDARRFVSELRSFLGWSKVGSAAHSRASPARTRPFRPCCLNRTSTTRGTR